MGCPNFSKVNALNYYVVSDITTRYDDEREEEVECIKDSFDYDMDMEFAAESAKEKGFESEKGSYNINMDGCSFLKKDNYEVFGKKWSDRWWNSIKFTEEIYARGGYYSGMLYDWDICVSVNGNNFYLSDYYSYSKEDFIEAISEEWFYYASNENEGMAKIQRKNFEKWLDKLITKFSEEADSLCEYICDETLVCGGVFSNGEAVYYKANTLRGKVNNIE